MQKIIGIGNSLVDVLAKVNNDAILDEMNLPKGSMQLISSEELALISRRMRNLEHTRTSGGSAANTMKALAHIGIDSGFIGKTAEDEFGLFFGSELKRAGVKTQLICRKSGSTGIASTFISPDGQRTFATYLGVSAELNDTDITPELFEGYDILYVEGYLVQNHQMIEKAIRLAKEKGMTVCLDLASYNIVENERNFFNHLITQYVDIVFANEEEGRAFTGEAPKEAAQTIGALCHIAIVKCGSRGACACSGNDLLTVPTEKVNDVVDTTGAGDYFAAGFLHAYTKGKALSECIHTGNLLAGAIIRVIGTTLQPSDWEQVSKAIDRI